MLLQGLVPFNNSSLLVSRVMSQHRTRSRTCIESKDAYCERQPLLLPLLLLLETRARALRNIEMEEYEGLQRGSRRLPPPPLQKKKGVSISSPTELHHPEAERYRIKVCRVWEGSNRTSNRIEGTAQDHIVSFNVDIETGYSVENLLE